MKFRELAEYLLKLEKEASRIEITKILADLFKKASENDIDKICYLALASLGPRYEGKVFNLAEKMVLRIISEAYDEDVVDVRKLYREKGDLGSVVFAIVKNPKSKIQNPKLSVNEVFRKLKKIADDEGGGSQERKVLEAANLLKKMDKLSAKYVVRVLVGKLRLGFSGRTIIDGLSWMEFGDKTGSADLKRAYEVVPDVGKLAKQVKKLGVKKASANPRPFVGVPVLPMLAQRLKSPADMILKMGKVSVEPKLDGLRVLIHFKRFPPSSRLRKGSGDFVRAYTRNMLEVSYMFPELREIKKQFGGSEIILDCEAVGLDPKTAKMANFQTTMTRRRKHAIGEKSKGVKIRFYVFDILLRNGKSYMESEYLERRKLLERVIIKGGLLEIVTYKLTEDPKVISLENKLAHKNGYEGIIVKAVKSKYVPGRTGWRWVKMKEEEKSHAKLSDTVDCVVMGYSAGRGKRTSFGMGQFLVGVRDGEKILTTTKVGTGLTDELLREMKKRLTKLEVDKKPKQYEVHKNLTPHFWVRPQMVVEIAADEITKSPSHTAGLALRFPRLIKIRTDKGVSEATSLKELRQLYKLQ